MYKYVLFDLDGTLTDPGEGITNSIVYSLKKFGIEVTDKTTLYPFIGPPLYNSFQKYYGFDGERSQKAVELYREYYRDAGIFENVVYDGIPEVLKALKDAGKTLVVATSKPEEFAVRILEKFGLSEYFNIVAGATMDGSRIEKCDVIRYALEKCKTEEKSLAVMVGDRCYDIIGAKSVGIASIGVLFGYGSLDELKTAGADYIAETPRDLLSILLHNERTN
ncbi:MAG: HAD family hydrolase [Clostridia bacterium]|nr:HAD family hydrolase [Clostridia bacterium]